MSLTNQLTKSSRYQNSSPEDRFKKGGGKGAYLKDNRPNSILQLKKKGLAINVKSDRTALLDSRPKKNSNELNSAIQRKENKTGLPNQLKQGIENLSGYAMDDVKVHYNSSMPTQLMAHAYAQGNEIHLRSGQEKHLPHEAWHVVQQKQGRVKPTVQLKGKVNINDDTGLEKEADIMGQKAMQLKVNTNVFSSYNSTISNSNVAQRAVDLTVNTTSTVNGRYFVKEGDTHVLYSLRAATDPKPESIYKRVNEISTNGAPLFKWRPNIRTFRDEERGQLEGDVNSSELIAGLDQQTRNPLAGGDHVQMPAKGLLGKNDCEGMATSLRVLMGSEGEDNTAHEAADNEIAVNGVIAAGDAGEMHVGDQMIHDFPLNAACNYHSATVVAKDGGSLVTLEAHVSKDLPHPEFHIRAGVAGFVADNNAADPDLDLGDRVRIYRAQGTARSAIEVDAMKDIYGAFAEHRNEYHLQPHSGVTVTVPLLNLRRTVLDSILATSTKRWSKFTKGKFKPGGVKAIRAIVNGTEDNQASNLAALNAAKVQATADAGRPSVNRHQITIDFYAAISEINIEGMASLQHVVNEMVRINGIIDARMQQVIF